jgi:predicted GNAT family acetyltransferase
MINGVVDHPEARRFELPLGEEIAAAYYRLEGDTVVLTHTEVPQKHSGQGVGTRLAEAVFEEIAGAATRLWRSARLCLASRPDTRNMRSCSSDDGLARPLSPRCPRPEAPR